MAANADGVPASYGELIEVLFALPTLVREKRRRDGLSLRAAGDHSGVGFNTVTRTERGEHCSLENAIRLLRWLDGHSATKSPALPGTDSPAAEDGGA